MNLFLFQYII